MKKNEAENFLQTEAAAEVLNASRLSTPRLLRKPIPATEDYFLTIGLHSQIEGKETADDWRVLAMQKSTMRIKPLTGEISCEVVYVVTPEGVDVNPTMADYLVSDKGHGTGWYLFPDLT